MLLTFSELDRHFAETDTFSTRLRVAYMPAALLHCIVSKLFAVHSRVYVLVSLRFSLASLSDFCFLSKSAAELSDFDCTVSVIGQLVLGTVKIKQLCSALAQSKQSVA